MDSETLLYEIIDTIKLRSMDLIFFFFYLQKDNICILFCSIIWFYFSIKYFWLMNFKVLLLFCYYGGGHNLECSKIIWFFFVSIKIMVLFLVLNKNSMLFYVCERGLYCFYHHHIYFINQIVNFSLCCWILMWLI